MTNARRHTRWRRVMFLGLPLLAAAAFPAPSACAHMPPTIYISVSVDAEEVTWQMVLMAGLLDAWLDLEAREVEALEPEAREAAKARIEAFFHEWGRVAIDGVPVRGVMRSLEFVSFVDHAVPWEYANIEMAFGAKGRPRQVALVWRNYDGGLGGWFDRIEAEVDGFGETSYYVFREREPEIVWHAPRRAPRSLLRRPPVVEGPPRVRVPVVSWAILLTLLLAVPLLKARGVDRRRGWAVVGLGLGLAAGFSDVARTEVEIPLGPGFERPSPEEAAYVFETLLRNVYRAFDYETEDAVYDTLAQTVQGDLLEDIYLEVFGSLILREEGGAVCKVQKVEVLGTEVEFPEDEHAPWYAVRSRWRVHGKVGHYGHTHVRVNAYDALFRVVLDGERWRIASMGVLEKERIDDPGR